MVVSQFFLNILPKCQKTEINNTFPFNNNLSYNKKKDKKLYNRAGPMEPFGTFRPNEPTGILCTIC